MTKRSAHAKLHFMLSIVLRPIVYLGNFTIFTKNSLLGMRNLHRRMGIFLQQIDFIGVQSLSIVTYSAVFIGAAMAFQVYVALHFFGMDSFLGASVGLALARELAPGFAG